MGTFLVSITKLTQVVVTSTVPVKIKKWSYLTSHNMGKKAWAIIDDEQVTKIMKKLTEPMMLSPTTMRGRFC